MRKLLVVMLGTLVLFCIGCTDNKENNDASTSVSDGHSLVTEDPDSVENVSSDEEPSDKDISENEENSVYGYRNISQDEAVKIMESQSGYIILDVRTQEEFKSGHIPGAICVPNEEISDKMPPELPDKSQLILIYCRSGNRSKQAAQKLFDMGYNNLLEFGGIIDWQGEVVTD